MNNRTSLPTITALILMLVLIYNAATRRTPETPLSYFEDTYSRIEQADRNIAELRINLKKIEDENLYELMNRSIMSYKSARNSLAVYYNELSEDFDWSDHPESHLPQQIKLD
jgi:hypothetical protein